MRDQSEPLDPHRLKAQKATTPSTTPITSLASPALRASPPPGLRLSDEGASVAANNEDVASGVAAEVSSRPRAFTEPITSVASGVETLEPQNYKVLLSNLPEAMLNDCMVRAMLEQAKLQDMEALAFRKGGKCLVTFSTYASAHHCVKHVDGRKWGNSAVPVSALYVRTVKRSAGDKVLQKSSADADAPVSVPACSLSAEAPEFVPFATKMSADAPAFNPDAPAFNPEAPEFQPMEKISTRDRLWSCVSTDAGDCVDEVGQGYPKESMAAWVSCT